MCGIVGYVGNFQAGPILLEGLSKLEYRGYDSAGIAVRNLGTGGYTIVKSRGRLQELINKTDDGESIEGTCGIGHTRWATHGEPSELNAHPHYSDDLNVIGVHNGIIENYQELREKLIDNGYSFYSDTDSEVAVKLIDYYYNKYLGTPVDAINHSLVRIRGSYAFAIMFRDYPGEIYVARKNSPIAVGVGEDGNYVASDVSPMVGHADKVYYIENLQMGRITADGVNFYNLNGDEISLEPSSLDWDAEAVEKCGYPHFMLKEINEQPRAITDTLNAYITDNAIDLDATGLTIEALKGLRRIYITACGSAYHVGLAAKYVLEGMARIPVDVDLASEFRYRGPIIEDNSLFITISQSGETADSLEALKLARGMGVPTLAIVNVNGSSIAREADHVMYTYAGKEIAVATTKAYSCQLIDMYLLAIKLAELRGHMTRKEAADLIDILYQLPDQIHEILSDQVDLQKIAANIYAYKDMFFIGRGIDYAIGLEGSLKVKEISYIHSEAYAAGELKHGTISLIDKGTPVIGIATQDHLFEKMVSNLEEVKCRGAFVMAITNRGRFEIEKTAEIVIYVPKTYRYFAASLAIIPLQLMAYYISINKGLDADKPRNLAKSVTVE